MAKNISFLAREVSTSESHMEDQNYRCNELDSEFKLDKYSPSDIIRDWRKSGTHSLRRNLRIHFQLEIGPNFLNFLKVEFFD